MTVTVRYCFPTAKGQVAWQNKTDSNYLRGIEFIDLSREQVESIKDCFDFYRKNAAFNPK